MSSVLPNQERQAWLHDSPLCSRIQELMSTVSVEFGDDLLDLMQRLPAKDLGRFIDIWSGIDRDKQTAFVAFVIAGEDPDGRFLAYLDENKLCQEAVDIAFRAHVESLHDLGRSVARADDALKQQQVELGQSSNLATILLETERLEGSLENVSEQLENMVLQESRKGAIRPLLDGFRQALQAIVGTRAGLENLAGRR